MKIPEAILKFGIFAWQFWGCIGMPRLLGHDPEKCEAVSSRQMRGVCAEIMPKQEAKAR
jgi:hypothetical protein